MHSLTIQGDPKESKALGLAYQIIFKMYRPIGLLKPAIKITFLLQIKISVKHYNIIR